MILDFDVIEKRNNGTLCQARLINDSYDSMDLTEFQVNNFTGGTEPGNLSRGVVKCSGVARSVCCLLNGPGQQFQ